MTDAPERPRFGIPWSQVGVVLAVLTALWAATLFFTGGLRPQTQIDVADLQKALAETRADTKTGFGELKAAQSALSAASANDKAQLADRIDAAKELLNSRLNGMWRPSDYAERDSHLHDLDARVDVLRGKVDKLEYTYGDLDKRVRR